MQLCVFPDPGTACWVIFHAFVVVCWLFSELTFRNTIKVSNSLDSNQDRQFAKVINRRQKLQLARKELKCYLQGCEYSIVELCVFPDPGITVVDI